MAEAYSGLGGNRHLMPLSAMSRFSRSIVSPIGYALPGAHDAIVVGARYRGRGRGERKGE